MFKEGECGEVFGACAVCPSCGIIGVILEGGGGGRRRMLEVTIVGVVRVEAAGRGGSERGRTAREGEAAWGG